jgi:hypothetical protein
MFLPINILLGFGQDRNNRHYKLDRQKDNDALDSIKLQFLPILADTHFKTHLGATAGYRVGIGVAFALSLAQLAALIMSFTTSTETSFTKNYVAFSGPVCAVLVAYLSGYPINVTM